MKITLADLILSAQAAAQKAHAVTSLLEQQTAKLQAFTASGFHVDDFPAWENSFNAQLEMLTAFSKQPSPATVAAAKAAAQTPLAPSPTAG